MKKRVIALLLCAVMLVTCMGVGVDVLTGDEDAAAPETTVEPSAEPSSTPEQAESDLFAQLMACETQEEMDALIDGVTEEEIAALLTEEQISAASEHYAALAPASEETQPTESAAPKTYPVVSAGPIIDHPKAPAASAPRKMARAKSIGVQSAAAASDTVESNGLVMKKTATALESGDYKIRLEAYATGETTMANAGVPVDIVLMLDIAHQDKRSGSMTEEKLAKLKQAAVNFINTVYDKSPYSRIALVSYANSASVISGNNQADEGALVVVNDGKDSLISAVNALTLKDNEAANSHFAAAAAVKIFQAANSSTQTYTLSNGATGNYKDCSRVALLFSAGVPGDRAWSQNIKAQTAPEMVALATMHLSTILKCDRNSNALSTDGGNSTVIEWGANVDGSGTWSKSSFESTNGINVTNYAGCGATVYCVGLDLPDSGDPHRVNIAKTNRPGALTNEYFYRVSSHRPTGQHYVVGSPGSGDYVQFNDSNDPTITVTRDGNTYQTNWRTDYGQVAAGYYDESNNWTTEDRNWLNKNSKADYSGEGLMYCFYPDYLTRNLDKGYFLTTDSNNLDRLNSIFKDIANQTGGSETELGATASIKDVMSEYFNMPSDVNRISVFTADFKGKNAAGEATWGNDTAFNTADVQILGNTVTVSNFNYKDNWCGSDQTASGTSNHGKKLIVEFTVSRKAEFLGGNDVPTNARSSGVYDGAGKPVEMFPVPTVNVPINASIAAKDDINVYYGGTVPNTKEELLSSIAAGNEFFDVIYDIPQISNQSDSNYTVTATIKPKTNGANSNGTANQTHDITDTAKVNVFTPVLTYKDSAIDLGTTPDYAAQNYVSEVWKHDGTDSTAVTMLGSKPTLELSYTPAAEAFSVDTPVKVTVKIGGTDVADRVRFEHETCTYEPCHFDNTQGQFIVHIKTFDLTITKSITSQESDLYGARDFVFNVKSNDGKTDIDVVVHVDANSKTGSTTIKGLPVGTYTITENHAWSWRYKLEGVVSNGTGSVNADLATYSATYTPSGTNNNITFTNSWLHAQWLSFTTSVRNIFGTSNNK